MWRWKKCEVHEHKHKTFFFFLWGWTAWFLSFWEMDDGNECLEELGWMRGLCIYWKRRRKETRLEATDGKLNGSAMVRAGEGLPARHTLIYLVLSVCRVVGGVKIHLIFAFCLVKGCVITRLNPMVGRHHKKKTCTISNSCSCRSSGPPGDVRSCDN